MLANRKAVVVSSIFAEDNGIICVVDGWCGLLVRAVLLGDLIQWHVSR